MQSRLQSTATDAGALVSAVGHSRLEGSACDATPGQTNVPRCADWIVVRSDGFAASVTRSNSTPAMFVEHAALLIVVPYGAGAPSSSSGVSGNASVSRARSAVVHSPVVRVGAGRKSTSVAGAPATEATAPLGSVEPSISRASGVPGSAAPIAASAFVYAAPVAPVGAGPSTNARNAWTCATTDAAYCVSAARPAASAGSGLAFSCTIAAVFAGRCCRVAAVVGSTAGALSGHVSCSRTSLSPACAASADCVASGTVAPTSNGGGASNGASSAFERGGFGFASVEVARTNESASNDAVLPPASVAVRCTPYAPARFGVPHDSVCQPPETVSRLGGPAGVTAVTVDGFEIQNESAPAAPGCSCTAGGCVSYAAKRAAASAKRRSLGASCLSSCTTYSW